MLKSLKRELAFLSLVCACDIASGQNISHGLALTFGARGLENLSYAGQVLEDLNHDSGDAFHIWHMQCFDAQGKPLTSGQYGWGENNNGRTWDGATHTWTYTFEWGTIRTSYLQHGDTLDVQVVESNRTGSGIVLDGASIYPLTLHLPGATAASTHIVDGVEEPGVTSVALGSSRLALVVPDETKPLYSGFQAGSNGAVQLIVSGTRPDALPHVANAAGRPVKPGETSSFVLSLRFGPLAESLDTVARDAFASYSQRWPQLLSWSDRRPIGTVFLASSPQGDKTHPAGYPANPRRYFNDAAVDVRADLPSFQSRVLRQAQTIVENLKRMGAQGAITWDIEGEEYPQDTSYLCAPDEVAHLAPEMESVLPPGQKYAGTKLDDAYFKIIHDAGFRVGVCVRPQHLELDAGSTARQKSLSDDQVATELIRKMRFAHDRWGATIFYIDSTVRADGSTLPAVVLERVAAAMPDSLLIPEESSARMYRATAPFETFLFHGDLGTSDAVHACYPHAFSVNMINDVAAQKLSANRTQLLHAARKGDILMGLVAFWQENDDAIAELYREAGHH